MKPYYSDDLVTVHQGDCLDVLRSLPDASVDSVVTDPPYGLGFMGKAWDDLPPGLPFATECLRVLKPGGHLLAFGGTRTWHRLACAVEDAGFEVRDSIAWMYGNGFPKSLDVSKAIDKGNGENRTRQLECTAWMRSTGITAAQINAATQSFMGSHYLTDRKQAAIPTADMFDLLRPLLPEVPESIERLIAERTGIEWTDYMNRPVLRQVKRTGKESGTYGAFAGDNIETASATETSTEWQGWGTALKPAFEPIVVARKPLAGTVAANVLAHGTGALNIDACRTATSDKLGGGQTGGSVNFTHEGWNRPWMNDPEAVATSSARHAEAVAKAEDLGRWPANVILDESQAEVLDEQSGILQSGANPTRRGSDKFRDAYGDFAGQESCEPARGADSGGASRFFYVPRSDDPCVKSTEPAPTVIETGVSDANDAPGMTGSGAPIVDVIGDLTSRFLYVAKADQSERVRIDGIAHPTVKPLALMRWLVRLVTPPGGTVLEPFAGSGTTVEACVLEGFQCIAIEREADYLPLIVQRINRRRDPVAAVKAAGDDGGLFDLLDGGAA